MSDEMIERVRAAIDQALCDQDGPISDAISKAARAAIGAMREWGGPIPYAATVYNDGPFGEREVRRIWREMVTALLADQPPKLDVTVRTDGGLFQVESDGTWTRL